jgi:toxin ParE1/3/4
MNKTIRSQLAQIDIDGIFDYIAEDNIDAAEEFILKLDQKFALLAKNPMLGRSRGELFPAMRSFPFGKYVIFYRAQEDDIVIMRVLHGSRDIETIFSEE